MKLSDLPVETIEYKLADEEKVCDNCQSSLTEMKKKSVELVVIQHKLKW